MLVKFSYLGQQLGATVGSAVRLAEEYGVLFEQ
jgi:hypothetical protein